MQRSRGSLRLPAWHNGVAFPSRRTPRRRRRRPRQARQLTAWLPRRPAPARRTRPAAPSSPACLMRSSAACGQWGRTPSLCSRTAGTPSWSGWRCRWGGAAGGGTRLQVGEQAAAGPARALRSSDALTHIPFYPHASPHPLQAWNAGQAAGAAGELQQAAVLMAVCGELYAALPAPGQAALHKRKVREWRALLRHSEGCCLVASTAAPVPTCKER